MITKEDQNARGSCIFNPHIYQKSSNADDVCELQSTKLATGIFLLSPATAINPTFQGLLIISFNLIIFFGMYLINPSSFSWRLSMLASLWQQWLVPMTLTSFWSFTSYNTFFSFKLIYNPSSNTERWTVNIRYALRVPVLLVFENRKIRNYKVTDFFSIQKLAIQNLSSFFQDPRWFMLPQGYRMINTKKSISNSNLFQTLKVKRNMFQVITTKTFMDQLDNFKLRNFAKNSGAEARMTIHLYSNHIMNLICQILTLFTFHLSPCTCRLKGISPSHLQTLST